MIVGVVAMMVFSELGSPTTVCPMAKSQIIDARALTGFIEDVNVIGKPDRQTAQDFAREEAGGSTALDIEQRYAASGDLVCGKDQFGQAQLVLRNDIILSAGHVFTPRHECPLPPTPPASECKFTTKVGRKITTYEVESVVSNGYVCTPDGKRPGFANDWVIFKLKKPVSPSIKPYGIANGTAVSSQDDIIQIGKSADFNPTHAAEMDKYARHFSRCQAQFIYKNKNLIETDCDASPGTSGGGVLTPGENPKLLAITTGSPLKPCPNGNGTNKAGVYEQGCWSTVSTTIGGDLLAALKHFEPDTNDTKPNEQSPTSSDFKDL